jgi:cell division cycle 2-like
MIISRGCTERCGDSLAHAVFRESPYPKHPDLFGSFPSAAAGEKYVSLLLPVSTHSDSPSNRRRKPFDSPSAPMRAADYKLMTEFDAP